MKRLAAGCCAALVFGACGPFCRPAAAPHRAARPTPVPPVGVRYLLDGAAAASPVRVTPHSHLRVAFTAQVPPAAVTILMDGQPLAADALAWSSDLLSVEVPVARIAPDHPVRLGVRVPPPLTDPGPLDVAMLPTVPSNWSAGIQPGFQPRTPIEIVVENSGPARPQAGLQEADIVYEYLSEYQTTRMTAIYFARIPSLIGPVRSCRMVNAYLGYAYAGVNVCSGVSDGTGGWLVGTTPGSRPVPSVIESSDQIGGHFFRIGSRAAPHNDYTSGDAAGRIRSEYPQPPGEYAVDPPHNDVPAGTPAEWPAVPPHSVTYAYDPGSGQYLRYDHGAPFFDQDTGQQLHAKNVVMLHLPYHDAGWVEDENGGAHSVWYDMTGTGPAEVYSNGQVVRATWHMGGAGQAYFDNHTPVWFTDESGAVLLLNTGLTWIHVLGNGQTG